MEASVGLKLSPSESNKRIQVPWSLPLRRVFGTGIASCEEVSIVEAGSAAVGRKPQERGCAVIPGAQITGMCMCVYINISINASIRIRISIRSISVSICVYMYIIDVYFCH